jgi:hypothetical protein
MAKQVVTTLPNGYWEGGANWREAHLREFTGDDHLFLIEQCQGLLRAHWVTEVLARCVLKLGPYQATREAVRSLTVGDREALLLHLRRLTLGDRLTCVLSCPECQEKLELEIVVVHLLQPLQSAVLQEYEFSIGREGGGPTIVRFRLPDGADQETIASLALTDVDAATDWLLRRCVLSISQDGQLAEELPASAGEHLIARMAELDSQAEINLMPTCEACGRSFSIVFDAGTFFFQELEAEAERLYREIHLLAFHYHWSPTEILSLSTRKRRTFLELLENELTKGGVQ